MSIAASAPSVAFALLLAFAAPLGAQAASYTVVGTSCTGGRISPGLGPVPLTVIGTPRLGGRFSIETESSARYPAGNRRLVFVIAGLSNTSALGVPLPFDLATLPVGEPVCGVLRTSVEVLTQVPWQQSYLTPSRVDFDVPNTASLLGGRFYQQVLSIERSPFGPPFRSVALSAGGEGVVGR